MEAEINKYLAEQEIVMTELLQLLREEQKAISLLDTAKMDELNHLKENAQERQRKLSILGREMISTLAGRLNLPNSSTLSDLIGRLDPKSRLPLEQQQGRIVELARLIKEVANENKGMLERFLGTVNESLSFLLRMLNTSNQYGSSGNYVQRTQSGAVIVNREA